MKYFGFHATRGVHGRTVDSLEVGDKCVCVRVGTKHESVTRDASLTKTKKRGDIDSSFVVVDDRRKDAYKYCILVPGILVEHAVQVLEGTVLEYTFSGLRSA